MAGSISTLDANPLLIEAAQRGKTLHIISYPLSSLKNREDEFY
jgi:hypothetical protein